MVLKGKRVAKNNIVGGVIEIKKKDITVRKYEFMFHFDFSVFGFWIRNLRYIIIYNGIGVSPMRLILRLGLLQSEYFDVIIAIET